MIRDFQKKSTKGYWLFTGIMNFNAADNVPWWLYNTIVGELTDLVKMIQ